MRQSNRMTDNMCYSRKHTSLPEDITKWRPTGGCRCCNCLGRFHRNYGTKRATLPTYLHSTLIHWHSDLQDGFSRHFSAGCGNGRNGEGPDRAGRGVTICCLTNAAVAQRKDNEARVRWKTDAIDVPPRPEYPAHQPEYSGHSPATQPSAAAYRPTSGASLGRLTDFCATRSTGVFQPAIFR